VRWTEPPTAGRLERVRQVLETRGFLLAAFVAMRLSLEFGYIYFVSPYFAYSGFILTPDPVKYFESWAIFILLIYLAPYRIQRTSDYLVIALVASVLLPILSFFALSDQPRGPVYMVLLGYAVILGTRNGRKIVLPRIGYGLWVAVILTALGAAVVSAWMLGSGGLRFFNLDLTAVYEYRRSSAEVTGRFGFQYLNVWATKVFGPFLLAVGLWRRWWLLVGIVVALHILWFGISAHRAVVFYPLLVASVWVWVRRLPSAGLLPFSIAVAVASSLLVYWAFGDSTQVSLRNSTEHVSVLRVFLLESEGLVVQFGSVMAIRVSLPDWACHVNRRVAGVWIVGE